MINALKNQADFAFSNAKSAKVAQGPQPASAVSARYDVIAKEPLNGEQQLESQARNLVAQTFYGTLMKQMHESPFKSDLFSGGRGGEAFGSLYDQHLVQRMAQRSGDHLVRPIVKKFKAAAAEAYERNKKFEKEHAYESNHR